jgi:PIN domain nuclease of toxin-antitoxin system
MRYLLDTHLILWLAFNDEKLSPKVRKLLSSDYVEIYLSAVSFWEISIKCQMGKLDLKLHNPETIRNGFVRYYDCQFLDLKIEETTSFFKLEKNYHKDPFDRMLIWQALQKDLALISDDEKIKLVEDTRLKVIWY